MGPPFFPLIFHRLFPAILPPDPKVSLRFHFAGPKPAPAAHRWMAKGESKEIIKTIRFRPWDLKLFESAADKSKQDFSAWVRETLRQVIREMKRALKKMPYI